MCVVHTHSRRLEKVYAEVAPWRRYQEAPNQSTPPQSNAQALRLIIVIIFDGRRLSRQRRMHEPQCCYLVWLARRSIIIIITIINK